MSDYKTPKGWVDTTIADLFIDPKNNIVDGPFGSNLKASEYKERGVPILRLQNIDRLCLDPKNIKYITSEKAQRLSRHSFLSGDIVMTKLGIPLGKACIIPETFSAGIIVADLVRLRPDNKHIDVGYLCHAINAPSVCRQLKKLTKGTTRPRVNLSHIRALSTHLPPINEQKRIVEKVEELFSQIDAGEVALKKAQVLIKQYRQSLLKAAITGELTKEWRDKNKSKLEPADKLLARILTERRKTFSGRGKFKGPSPSTDGLPELPTGWTWAKFDQLGEFGRGKSKHRPRNDPRLFGNEYPFLQTGTVRESQGLIKKYDKMLSAFGLAQSKLWPKGTLCITIAANIAETGILDFDACFPDSVVGLTPHHAINIFFIEFFVRTVRDDLDRYAPATAQKNINMEILNDVFVPLPPSAEQRKIVEEVQSLFVSLEYLEKTLFDGLLMKDALRQSILKSAFSGQLLSQNPKDEPAITSLDRIKAERESRTKATKRSPKRAKFLSNPIKRASK